MSKGVKTPSEVDRTNGETQCFMIQIITHTKSLKGKRDHQGTCKEFKVVKFRPITEFLQNKTLSYYHQNTDFRYSEEFL